MKINLNQIAAGTAGLLISAAAVHAEPALTIYNQNFAVVRDTVPLDLKAGPNAVRYTGATAQVEPDSVILRDPAGKVSLQILEQNYRNDPVSEGLLLSLFEGKTIDFQDVRMKDNTQIRELIPGKIVRSGYVPNSDGDRSPIIEVNGKLQFSLPGQPLFPDLGDDTVLKPSFNWLLQASQPGQLNAEIGYITSGLNWSASYNLVSPETGDLVDLSGLITMNNNSGKVFENARIQLMAGEVNRIQPQPDFGLVRRHTLTVNMAAPLPAAPPVTEKAFDEFHLYSVTRPTTLHNNETKQVEFVHAEKMYAPTIYVFDGAAGWQFFGLNIDRGFGQNSDNRRVMVQREFKNAETNQLGVALPAGRLRFYRRDADGQLQFVGENTIDHTPRNETVRVTTGNAFDLVGERKQTNFRIDTSEKWMDESFEIKLRNRKKDAPVEIRVVERLYRWSSWNITAKSNDFEKKDAQTIEFRVPVKPDEEKVITYTVHYSW